MLSDPLLKITYCLNKSLIIANNHIPHVNYLKFQSDNINIFPTFISNSRLLVLVFDEDSNEKSDVPLVCTRLLKSFWQLEKLDTPYKIVLSTPKINSLSLLIWKSNDWFEQLNRKTAQFEKNPIDCLLKTSFRCFTYHLNKYGYRFIASFIKALTSSN